MLTSSVIGFVGLHVYKALQQSRCCLPVHKETPPHGSWVVSLTVTCVKSQDWSWVNMFDHTIAWYGGKNATITKWRHWWQLLS